jgi:hypothetical protein
MSLNYFLFVKEKHANIFSYLNEIISIYEELQKIIDNIENLDENYNNFEDIEMYKNLANDYKSKLRIVTSISNSVNDIINNLCNHDYIYDTIDIDLDTSKTICYCSVCGISK